MQYFGIKLKNLRENHKMTQSELAEYLGVVTGTVSAYEQNRTYPSIEILIKICTFFNVSADFMIGISKEAKITNSYLTDGQMNAVHELIKALETDNISGK